MKALETIQGARKEYDIQLASAQKHAQKHEEMWLTRIQKNQEEYTRKIADVEALSESLANARQDWQVEKEAFIEKVRAEKANEMASYVRHVEQQRERSTSVVSKRAICNTNG